MAVLDNIVPETRDRVAAIGQADLVAALPACQTGEQLEVAMSRLRPALAALLPGRTTVILHPDRAIAAPNGVSPKDTLCHLLPYPMPPVDRNVDPSLERALGPLLRIGSVLNARTFVLLGSAYAGSAAEDVLALAGPVAHHSYDLAVPLHPRRRFSNLINKAIANPLTRSLYGRRLNHPMAVDFALSARLADRHAQAKIPSQPQPGWIVLEAIVAKLQICQVHREAPPAPAASEPADISVALSQVLSALFLDAERNAGIWQRVRGSEPVPSLGQPGPAIQESSGVNVQDLVATFQRGYRDLLSVWSAVLSPATLVEFRKLAKLPADQFRMPDQIWAHVLYDCMLGHRQRVINREHLLLAITPIYLGWVASYALEVQSATPEFVNERLEKLWATFESLKPYLVSRWRWPDRFNP